MKTIYVCDTCGRFSNKPLTINHFKVDMSGVCGAPTGPVEYVRKELADAVAESLADCGLSSRTEKVLAKYHQEATA